MQKRDLVELFKRKKYPDYFSRDLISLYPYMIKYFGQEAIDKFLIEWNYLETFKLEFDNNYNLINIVNLGGV